MGQDRDTRQEPGDGAKGGCGIGLGVKIGIESQGGKRVLPSTGGSWFDP